MLTELKYKTFDELLEDVSVDFSMYSLEGMIEPQQLIKVVQRVNYDLGLRIFMTKEAVLDISNGKVRMPDDFYVLNYALLCGSYKVETPALSGTTTEDIILENIPDDAPCNSVCVNDCGQYIQVVQKLKYETRVYEVNAPLAMSGSSKTLSCDCPDTTWKSPYQGKLKNGYIYTNIDSGKLYINYQGTLEDEDGNLLLIDNPTINEYYEYALKQRILENMYMDGEEVVQKLNLIEQRYRAARNNALSLVNTPNFEEMKKMMNMNRKAMSYLYYDMFKSYNPNSYGL
jgi:hypothetical protein